MEEDPIIVATFSEACSARYLFNHYSKEVGTVTIFFHPKKIIISVRNPEGYAMIETVIQVCELEYYLYDVRTPSQELADIHPIVVNSQKLMLATKPITKRDGLKMIVYPTGQSLYMETLIGRKSGPVNMVPIIDGETPHMMYVHPTFHRAPDDPNVSIYAREFSTMCNSMVIMKCVRVEILLYESGVVFNGYGIDGSKIRAEEYGSKEGPWDRINVPIKTIKSLSKINVFSTAGSKIRVFHHDGMVKIVSPVGTYGIYTILLRSASEPATGK